MSRLLLAIALAAIVGLVGAFVPFEGKSLVERWNAAPSASQFAERGWNEVTARWDRLWGTKPASRQASRTTPARAPAGAAGARAPAPAPGKAPGPAEHHTDADRSALDRIVAEHSADPAPPRR